LLQIDECDDPLAESIRVLKGMDKDINIRCRNEGNAVVKEDQNGLADVETSQHECRYHFDSKYPLKHHRMPVNVDEILAMLEETDLKNGESVVL
jgi:hypothetical protein